MKYDLSSVVDLLPDDVLNRLYIYYSALSSIYLPFKECGPHDFIVFKD